MLIDYSAKPLRGPNRHGKLCSFSESIDLSHEDLLGKIILLEFEPRTSIQGHIEKLVAEVEANTETAVILTRKRSDIDLGISSSLVEKYYLVPSNPRYRDDCDRMVPLNDTPSLLGFIMSKVSNGVSYILLDSLTDLILNSGHSPAYSIVMHMADILAEKGTTLVLLMNSRVHRPDILASFEAVANMIVVLEEGRFRLVKGLGREINRLLGRGMVVSDV